MKYDVITIGSAVKDVFLKSDKFKLEKSHTAKEEQNACFTLGGKIEIDKPIFSTGGGATNASATFAHLGLKTATIALIGDDQEGKDIIQDLKTHGIYTNLIQTTDKHKTGYSTLLTASTGQRTAMVYRGASAHLTKKQIPWNKINTKWIYLTSLGGDMLLAKAIIDFCAKNDIHITWNPGTTELKHGLKVLAPLIKRVDILSLNKEESSLLTKIPLSDTRGIIKKIQTLTGNIFIMTNGKKGTYACKKDHCFFAHPTKIKVINTAGSGDAFTSAFTTGILLYEQDVPTALRLGTLNAESVIQKFGAKNGLLKRLPGTRRQANIKIEPYIIH